MIRNCAVPQTARLLPLSPLAVDRDFKNKQTGEKETDFIDMIAWRSTAEFVARYFTKGRMAVVEGRLQIRLWEDRDGNKRKSAEVIADSVYFGDSKKDNDGRSDQNYPAGGYSDVPGGRGTPPSAPVYSIPDFTEVDDDGDFAILIYLDRPFHAGGLSKRPCGMDKVKKELDDLCPAENNRIFRFMSWIFLQMKNWLSAAQRVQASISAMCLMHKSEQYGAILLKPKG